MWSEISIVYGVPNNEKVWQHKFIFHVILLISTGSLLTSPNRGGLQCVKHVIR